MKQDNDNQDKDSDFIDESLGEMSDLEIARCSALMAGKFDIIGDDLIFDDRNLNGHIRKH